MNNYVTKAVKLIRRLLPFLVCLFALLLLFVLLSPMIMFTLADRLVKAELDNPYVNSDYQDWNEIVIAPGESFMIPNEWSIQGTGAMRKIIDSEGNTISHLGVLGETSKYLDTSAFFQDLLFCQTVKIETDYDYGDYVMPLGTSTFYRASIQGDDYESSFYCLELSEKSNYGLIIAFSTENADLSSLFDIAQAILYSYTFPVD